MVMHVMHGRGIWHTHPTAHEHGSLPCLTRRPTPLASSACLAPFMQLPHPVQSRIKHMPYMYAVQLFWGTHLLSRRCGQ